VTSSSSSSSGSLSARTVATAVLAAVLGLGAACSSGDDNGNPPVLWLDLDGSEIKVRLVEREPIPF
jgi:hypothetical protein